MTMHPKNPFNRDNTPKPRPSATPGKGDENSKNPFVRRPRTVVKICAGCGIQMDEAEKFSKCGTCRSTGIAENSPEPEEAEDHLEDEETTEDES